MAIKLNGDYALQWYCKAVGEIFYLRDDLTGVAIPPQTSPDFRYIKLTAGDAYNTGALDTESVTGSAPLVIATAKISFAASPLNGLTVNLINTERRVLRAGSSGVVEQDALQGFSIQPTAPGGSGTDYGWSGTANKSQLVFPPFMQPALPVDDGTHGVPRIANETRVKSLGATAYMRIL